ncbi:MAG: discoidin domain-containing protein [Thermomicrobiales bacterium]
MTPPPASTRYVIAGGGRTSSSTSSLLAYDNNTTTSWYTTTSGIPRAAYVYFDLGAVKSVSKVQWYFARTGPADSFRIQVSSDKSSWTTISTRSNGKGAAWESFAWKGQARYVRFYFDNPNKDTVLGYLGEVRIYFLSIAPACLQPSRSAGWTVRPGVVVPGWRL